MRYADSFCECVEKYEPHVYIFTGRCMVTKEPYSVTVPAEELNAYRRGNLIQDAMPSVSDEDREFLVSGYSPRGWKKVFG
jgi:hypothetical protein